MKIFEGNLITPIEDYQGKWALSPCGNVTDTDFNGKEGWFIIEPLKQYEKYVNGVLTVDNQQRIKDLKTVIVNKYATQFDEFDKKYSRLVALGNKTSLQYNQDRSVIQSQLIAELNEVI